MPVAWQNIELPLGSGMDDSASQAALPPGKPISLVNAHFGADGALSKRAGFDTLLGGALSVAGQLLAYAQHLLAVVAGHLYDYASTGNYFADRGTARAVPTSTTVLKSQDADIPSCDIYSVGGFTMSVWYDGTQPKAQITDEATGAMVSANTLIFSASDRTKPSALGFVDGTNLVHFYVICANQMLHAQQSSAGFTWDASATTIVAGTFSIGRACIDTANAFIYFGCVGSSGVAFAKVAAGIISVLSSATVAGATVATGSPIAVSFYSGVFYLAYQDSASGVAARSLTISTATWIGDVNIDANATAGHMAWSLNPSNGHLVLLYDDSAKNGTHQAVIYQSQQLPSFVAPAVLFRSVSLASDAIWSGGTCYFEALYYSKVTGAASSVVAAKFPDIASMATLNSAAFVVTLDGAICARVLRDSAMTMPGTSSASAISSGLLFGCRALSQAESATIQDALSLGAVAAVRFQIANEHARGVTASRDLLIAGGSPLAYDGTTPAEAGFHVYPEAVATIAPAASGDYNTSNIARSTQYALGQVLLFDDVNTSITSPLLFVCVTAGKTAASQPTYFTTVGSTTTDGTAVFQAVGYQSPRTWTANTLYSTGKTLLPIARNGLEYAITNIDTANNPTGNTGTTEPTWPTSIGATVVQNFITYQCIQKERGQLASGKSYTYQHCYASVDDQGQLHRSSATVPAAITLGTPTTPLASNSIVVVSALRLTARADVHVEVYRTGGDGTVCQQILNLANDESVDAVAFMDTTPDTTQALGAVLYQGELGAGEFAARPPPSCSAIAVFGQRAWANSLESPFSIFPSKLLVDGYGASWADELAVQLNGAYGAFQAAQEMDGILYVFQERAISLLSGDGVDNTGAGTPFGQPIELATDVGCSNPDSIVLTPAGILFQSQKGIYLLARDRSTSFIGEPVRNDLTGTVLAACVDPTTHQALMVANGNIFAYDYERGAWAIWELGLTALQSIAAWNGKPVVLDNNGNVVQQSGGTYLDKGSGYSFSMELAPVRFAGVQGYVRARAANLIFKTGGGSSVTVGVKQDYADAMAYTLPGHALATAQDSMQVLFRTQKVSTIGLVITEVVTGGSLVLEGVAFQVGVKRGLARKPVGKRVG